MTAPLYPDLDDPGDALLEPYAHTPVFYSGARAYVIDGVAHFIFYGAQPGTEGRLEYNIVARMIAPLPNARATIERLGDRIRVGAPIVSCFDGELVVN
jgi:hypothetical protein